MSQLLVPGLQINNLVPIQGCMTFVFIGNSHKITLEQVGRMWVHVHATVCKITVILN